MQSLTPDPFSEGTGHLPQGGGHPHGQNDDGGAAHGYYQADPRDQQNVDIDEINNNPHYMLESVFTLDIPLPSDHGKRNHIIGESIDYVNNSGTETRGWYDIGGFRSDADLMIWWLADNPETLQTAYHHFNASALGRRMSPFWSAMGVHVPAEFNPKHVPACFAGVAPRDWLMVYPFVRSYEWYILPPEERSACMKEHGQHGFARYPKVKGSTVSTFGFSDYEWLLAFEADTPGELEGVIREQRYTRARRHVRKEIPFFTGRRIDPYDWAALQPLS